MPSARSWAGLQLSQSVSPTAAGFKQRDSGTVLLKEKGSFYFTETIPSLISKMRHTAIMLWRANSLLSDPIHCEVLETFPSRQKFSTTDPSQVTKPSLSLKIIHTWLFWKKAEY
jgi:hypothetical protein